MKVFVSYSFLDSELHLLTLLLEKMRDQGHFVNTSNSFLEELYNSSKSNVNVKISNSDFFIGIITNESNGVGHVINEWRHARLKSIKNILLIEKGVKVSESNMDYIEFDRNNPEEAINRLFDDQEKNKSTNSIGDALLVGAGIILGIAALIALLGKKEK